MRDRVSRLDLVPLLVNLAGGLALAMVAGTYLLFDYLAAASLFPVAALIACAASLPGSVLIAYGRRSRAVRIALPLLVIALLLSVSLINWNTRKPFLRAFNQIESGMTVDQVDRIMASYMRGPAGAGSLSESGTVVYRHTNEGWGNSDIGLVLFADGHVTEREFLPD